MPASMHALYATAAYDVRLFAPELRVLTAHVEGLEDARLLSEQDVDTLQHAIEELLQEGPPAQTPSHVEDIYEHIQGCLARRVGEELASQAHIGKARNDSSVTSLRLWLRGEYRVLAIKLCRLVDTLARNAGAHPDQVMPGFTHGQVAQPITFAHYCLAQAHGFLRDLSKLLDAADHLNECPLGSGALAGSSLGLDRERLASRLGFTAATSSTLDAVSDRDFVLDACYVASLLGLRASRLAEDFIHWSSPSVGMLDLPDALVTRSSILPHKRNPDALELVRAKAARLSSNLARVQGVLKGLPLGYLRDLQEDKEPLFDSVDTVSLCLDVLCRCCDGLELRPAAMAAQIADPRYLSSDLVDRLIRERGLARSAAFALVTDALSASQSDAGAAYAELCAELDPATCVERRDVVGATSRRAIDTSLAVVAAKVQAARARLEELPS